MYREVRGRTTDSGELPTDRNTWAGGSFHEGKILIMIIQKQDFAYYNFY